MARQAPALFPMPERCSWRKARPHPSPLRPSRTGHQERENHRPPITRSPFITRRDFLKRTGLGSAGLALVAPAVVAALGQSPNNKLNIGVIGTANRAGADLKALSRENIVALCDVDQSLLAVAKDKFPQAKTYTDFRKMLEQTDIDAVVVGTADHTHAVATSAALRLGKHVYCEKPLTHTVFEARTVAGLAAANKKLATQMGTQIHAGDNYRRVVELVQSGAIGAVSECHVWCQKSLQGAGRPTDMPPIPKNLEWDLWLGPAAARPYHREYIPKTWRRWWDFGEGILGDMACHYMDLPFWALNLRSPLTVEAEGPPVNPEIVPAWLIVRYEFPARGPLPPLRLTWYDGGKRPEHIAQEKATDWPNGVLFVGDKGMLIADYNERKLLPEARYADFQPPSPSIPKSIGHHEEWVQACKTGAPTSCNFAYGSALTETVLLGNVAYRTGLKLDWDAKRLKARNTTQAMNYLRTEYRKGWEV
jgi:predicted dehydrogenase